jgi:hypothetical protein
MDDSSKENNENDIRAEYDTCIETYSKLSRKYASVEKRFFIDGEDYSPDYELHKFKVNHFSRLLYELQTAMDCLNYRITELRVLLGYDDSIIEEVD